MLASLGTVLALSLAAFVTAWWLGLYLLARDAGRPVMRRTAAGLLAYALAVALVPFDGVLVEHIHAVLAGLPALAWTGVHPMIVSRFAPHRV